MGRALLEERSGEKACNDAVVRSRKKMWVLRNDQIGETMGETGDQAPTCIGGGGGLLLVDPGLLGKLLPLRRDRRLLEDDSRPAEEPRE